MSFPRLGSVKLKLFRGVRDVFAIIVAVSLVGLSPPLSADAQDQAKESVEKQTPLYSPDVVSKADKILADIGIRRAGKSLAATNTADVSRAMSTLLRERRQLKLVYTEWEKASQQLMGLQQQMKRLNIQDGELNLQLARVAGTDVSANNRVVGLINAGRTQIKILDGQVDQMREIVASKRDVLSQAESSYAEKVLAIRKDFDAVEAKLRSDIASEKSKIALQVMHRNFQTPKPKDVTPNSILASVEKRLEKIEQAVFSETIPLDVQRNGSLFVDVVIGKKSMPMVVDSGATLISLTTSTAEELGITVPSDAPELKLIMADGREIPAKAVVIARVRVGEFEAENVRAAVLHPSANGAEPLLGMSFLGNFKFEINANDKTLKMLRVSAE